MAQLPADVSPGDGSHDDHHDELHRLYNHHDTLGGGDVTAAWTAAEKSKLAGITISTFGASLIDDADAAAARTTLGVSVPAVLDEDDMASNSATGVPSQQSVKAYVDAEVAGVGAGTIPKTEITQTTATLSITRTTQQQEVWVNVGANVTAWTDNQTTGDVWTVFLLGNGGGTNYTVDLSTQIEELDVITVNPDSEIELSIRKRNTELWGVVKVWAVGTPA